MIRSECHERSLKNHWYRPHLVLGWRGRAVRLYRRSAGRGVFASSFGVGLVLLPNSFARDIRHVDNLQTYLHFAGPSHWIYRGSWNIRSRPDAADRRARVERWDTMDHRFSSRRWSRRDRCSLPDHTLAEIGHVVPFSSLQYSAPQVWGTMFASQRRGFNGKRASSMMTHPRNNRPLGSGRNDVTFELNLFLTSIT